MKYIVDFHNDALESDINQYLLDNGCAVLKEWNNFDKVYLVEASVKPPVTSIVAFVQNDEDLLALKPLDIEINNFHHQKNPTFPEITISTSENKDWWKNYSLMTPVFDQPTATYTQKGSNIHVYIMDSGIKADHPEFEGVQISNVYSVTPGDFSDNKGHGTALASVISGKTCGISSAKLKIVKIYDPSHVTMQSEFLDALDAVMTDVPDDCFAILNCSWSIPRNEWVEFKLKECIDDGIWVVAAAGNSGLPIDDVTPAAMPEAFTVGAYNKDLLPCDFSSYTGTSEISVTSSHTNIGDLNGWAPGEDIWVATLNGGYGYVAGTSLSCAITCAIAAHNTNDLTYSDGRRMEDSKNTLLVGPDISSWLVMGRPGLLDLSDPKYSNSKNVIATLLEGPTSPQLPDEVFGTTRVGEKNVVCKVFSPHNTKSVEAITPLPDNFKLLPNGSLFAEPTAEQGPSGNESYNLVTYQIKRIGLDDVEEIVKVDVYILRSNYQPSELPNDHPINILLLFNTCQGVNYIECGLIYSSNCLNQCSGGWCCTFSPTPTKTSFCNCYDSFGYQNR